MTVPGNPSIPMMFQGFLVVEMDFLHFKDHIDFACTVSEVAAKNNLTLDIVGRDFPGNLILASFKCRDGNPIPDWLHTHISRYQVGTIVSLPMVRLRNKTISVHAHPNRPLLSTFVHVVDLVSTSGDVHVQPVAEPYVALLSLNALNMKIYSKLQLAQFQLLIHEVPTPLSMRIRGVRLVPHIHILP